MDREKRNLFERLLPVMTGLYDETRALSTGDGELQLWYNRGYADGMASAMRQSGYATELESKGVPAALSIDDATAFLPWGKAYRHGFEQGERETGEVLGAAGP